MAVLLRWLRVRRGCHQLEVFDTGLLDPRVEVQAAGAGEGQRKKAWQ